VSEQSTDGEQRRCPVCGELLLVVVVEGPTEAIGLPCEHTFPPDALGD